MHHNFAGEGKAVERLVRQCENNAVIKGHISVDYKYIGEISRKQKS